MNSNNCDIQINVNTYSTISWMVAYKTFLKDFDGIKHLCILHLYSIMVLPT